MASLRLSHTLSIALGANLGDPAATLVQVRPLLEEVIRDRWPHPARPGLRWSPLFRTAPVGGPKDQPAYLNAALVAVGSPQSSPTSMDPRHLLHALQALEARFGRLRRERWGPRRLDLDLLWCGDLALSSPELELPHPRLAERTFVLAPLAAIDPSLPLALPGSAERPSCAELLAALDPFLPRPTGAAAGPPTCGEALAALLPRRPEPPPRRLPPRPGWPE
jgi:2-amino-4-hydroxy-6-hydroxymethyldihydropteridine diphosphokinase